MAGDSGTGAERWQRAGAAVLLSEATAAAATETIGVDDGEFAARAGRRGGGGLLARSYAGCGTELRGVRGTVSESGVCHFQPDGEFPGEGEPDGVRESA